ncbi:unnamed protein product [Microthlaspi erraticum]|uniref:F-box domain-containing protein n=1 Tax=Microthlaspi erraticum TaxID=1685480 RepID=A0A6D2L8P9_9BRAS|nr:unnamed protein product [Microthlaspi erraticum]
MAETTETCGRTIEERRYEDRISALPQDLLIQILMLIPTKEVVATMILCKRWRFIWTMVPTLDDDDDDDDDDDADDDSKQSVWWFLNKSMELHKAPVLDTLSIQLGSRCPGGVDVGKWVASAVDRGVRLLRLKLCLSPDPTTLPKSLYSCESLVLLTLSQTILVDVPFLLVSHPSKFSNLFTWCIRTRILSLGSYRVVPFLSL